MAAYELTGDKWGAAALGTSGGQVTWSFATTVGAFFAFDASIGDATYQQLIRDAFNAWEAVANIDFVEVVDSTGSDIRLGWDAIDGAFNTVGEAGWGSIGGVIQSAEIRFDTAETWNTNKFSTDLNFFAVALHEIGHAIGLGHSTDPNTIMYFSTGPALTLTAPDIAGVHMIYGSSSATSFNGTAFNDIIDGTNGDDVIVGFDGDDSMYGYDGNDQIWAGSGDTGDDLAFGGNGNDVIGGGAGADNLYGEAGADILFGGSGEDWMEGGSGNDVAWAGTSNDRIVESNGTISNDILGGGEGDDTVQGGGGADTIYGGQGSDFLNDDDLYGDDGNDLIFGGNGFDLVAGGAGHDLLFGGSGNDTIDGGSGDDDIWSGTGNDLLIGGTGLDIFGFSPGNGDDTITDFSFAEGDLIDLIDYNTSFAELEPFFFDDGGNAVVDLGGGNYIELVGIDFNDLIESDFLF